MAENAFQSRNYIHELVTVKSIIIECGELGFLTNILELGDDSSDLLPLFAQVRVSIVLNLALVFLDGSSDLCFL